MLKIVFISAVVVVLGFFGIAALQPSTYRVERVAHISAPPSEVYLRVNDLHRFNEWNPWARLDPDVKNSFTGPASGPGASMAWAGNRKVGEGSMTITEVRQDDLIRVRMDFVKPFKDSSLAEFTFKPEGAGTVVSWSMSGKKNLFSKAMCLVMNMDRMIGGQFEKGLADLKREAETASKI